MHEILTRVSPVFFFFFLFPKPLRVFKKSSPNCKVSKQFLYHGCGNTPKLLDLLKIKADESAQLQLILTGDCISGKERLCGSSGPRGSSGWVEMFGDISLTGWDWNWTFLTGNCLFFLLPDGVILVDPEYLKDRKGGIKPGTGAPAVLKLALVQLAPAHEAVGLLPWGWHSWS